MKYRNLGRTGLRVSEVGFGAWAIGGNAHGNSYGPTDDAESVAAVRKAVELGVNLFDTADVYGWGHSERILGEALQGVRDDVLIATKVGGDFYGGLVRMNFSPTYIPFALERSLERLRTDRVDLYQLHNPPLEVLFDEDVMGVLEMLKEKGKVGHVGISIHEPEEGVAAIGTGSFEAIQLPFNALRLEWLDELFPLAREKGVGIVAREPLANGFLTGKYTETSAFPPGDIRHRWPPSMMAAYVGAARQLAFLVEEGKRSLAQAALKFVLSHPEVSTTIPGAKTVAHVVENAGAGEGEALSPEQVTRVYELHRRGFRG